jgi:hypothetical protein
VSHEKFFHARGEIEADYESGRQEMAERSKNIAIVGNYLTRAMEKFIAIRSAEQFESRAASGRDSPIWFVRKLAEGVFYHEVQVYLNEEDWTVYFSPLAYVTGSAGEMKIIRDDDMRADTTSISLRKLTVLTADQAIEVVYTRIAAAWMIAQQYKPSDCSSAWGSPLLSLLSR